MTYIIGWKQHNSVFLCADTAMTTAQVSSTKTMSSFGERHFTSEKCYVAEGAIKLVNLGSAAAAISGHWAPAHALLEEFADRLKLGETPDKAIERAVTSNTPLKPERPYNLIVAFSDMNERVLLGFNVNGDQSLTVVPDQTLIQFGSISPKYKSITPQMIKLLARTFAGSSSRLLVGALGVLQGFGVHDYLPAMGVGGAFCGLSVDSDGVKWQSDTLTVVHSPGSHMGDMVSSIVRENVLVVRSTMNNSCGYFGDTLMGGIGRNWRKRYWDATFDHIRSGKYDFVVFLSKANRNVTIVEMKQKLKSDYLHVIPPSKPTGGDFELRLDISPTVRKQMSQAIPDRKDGTMPFCISWTPFNKPPSHC